MLPSLFNLLIFVFKNILPSLKEQISSVPCRNRDYRNSDMRVAEVRQFCKLDDAGNSLVRAAMSQLDLSAWEYHRVHKLARTIADQAGSDEIQSVHLAEALQYCPKLMLG